MSEIQIQHVELNDSESSQEDSIRKHQGPIEVIEDETVNRLISLKKPAIAALVGGRRGSGRRGSHGPSLS